MKPINKEHPRIKNRTPEEQERRDNLARRLNVEKSRNKIFLLLDLGYSENAAEIIAKYGYTKKGFMELIKNEERGAISGDMIDFHGLDTEVAKTLFDRGEGRMVSSYIRVFHDLDKEIAEKLIEAGERTSVVAFFDVFLESDHKEIDSMLVKKVGPGYKKEWESFMKSMENSAEKDEEALEITDK